MNDIPNWIRTNKLPSALITVLIIAVLILSASKPVSFISTKSQPEIYSYESTSPSMGSLKKSAPSSETMYYAESTNNNVLPQDRKVIGESSLSLQVKNVDESIRDIKNAAVSFGGFTVSSNVNFPMESASGQITIRIPNTKAEEFLSFLRSNSVKVVSEDIIGTDVTDQYIDNDARLAVLNETKSKFEKIMLEAVKIEDILRVQNEIINLQYQIDSIKGSQKNIEQTSSTTRIIIYLSTDEFSLPYAPDNNWRPDVVFKTAVRSLVMTFRGFADNLIWLGVYSIIWLPILILIIYTYKTMKNSANNKR